MSRTIRASKEWFQWLSERCIGSSGYNGSLIGMRNLYWGKDAYVVRCCGYLFNVKETDFQTVRLGEKI